MDQSSSDATGGTKTNRNIVVVILSKLWIWFTRRKEIDWLTVNTTNLKRCLTTVDLTALGIGATLGAGAYVLAGQEAAQSSGPSVILSFLIAAIASLLAALCYAEFAARVPRAGSAYVYSYVTVGELIAFFIGWNLLLEYVIGTASVASAWSGYLDSLCSGRISQRLNATVPMNVRGLGPYPDFVAFAITMVLTCVVAFGVGESAVFNNVLTVINLAVILFVIICGFFKANLHNWSLSQAEAEKLRTTSDQNVGKGGFFPFGVGGMLTSASSCFYGFVGFDAVATTAEEAKNPQRSIPLAIVISLAFICCAYFGISAVITLMTPYPLLNVPAPLSDSFDKVGWHSAKYIVSVGALCALTTSLFGAMFPMPRIVYAMSSDGLIFRILAKVYSRTQTPVIATFLVGLFTGKCEILTRAYFLLNLNYIYCGENVPPPHTAVFAMIFSLVDLVNMMSIGTLLAYTLVAICVVILRYSPEEFPKPPPLAVTTAAVDNQSPTVDDAVNDEPPHDNSIRRGRRRSAHSEAGKVGEKPNNAVSTPPWRKIFPCRPRIREPSFSQQRLPTARSSTLVNSCLAIFTAFCFILSASITFILPLTTYAWIPTAIFIAIVLASGTIIALQPKNPQKLAFRVPWAPYWPLISVFINSYLMVALPGPTWIRFLVWLAVGLLLYLGYGIKHSSVPLRGATENGITNELQPLEAHDNFAFTDSSGDFKPEDGISFGFTSTGDGASESIKSTPKTRANNLHGVCVDLHEKPHVS